MSKENKSSLGSKIKYAVVGVVVGAALAIGGTIAIQGGLGKGSGTDVIATSVVFDRIEAMNELVSVEQKYTITEKATNTKKLFEKYNIPFTTNSFWYRYDGTLKAGVNLANASFETSGNTVTVTLEAPYIISNTPDMEKTGVLEENNNVLNMIEVADVDKVLADCKKVSEEKAIEGGLLEEAKTNAVVDIANMLVAALGDDCIVEVIWA